jgi:hypothetical protein
MVHYSTFWLNSFPANDEISNTLSPRAIIVGSRVDYAKHCQLEFRSYVQTHEEHDNPMATWTTGAIALRPTGNAQGGHFFLSLTTGCVIRNGTIPESHFFIYLAAFFWLSKFLFTHVTYFYVCISRIFMQQVTC